MAAIQVVNYPIPNGTSSTAPDERLTVSSTVVTLAAFAANTQYVYFDVQTNDIMVTFDGSDPSSTNGHRFLSGRYGFWHVNTAQKARFIRATGSDGVIHVSQFAY